MENKLYCEFCGKNISEFKIQKHLVDHHINSFENLKELTKYGLKLKYKLSNDELDNILGECENTNVYSVEVKYKIRIRKLLKYLEIKPKSAKDVMNSEYTKNKRIQKIKEIYGVDNVSKNSLIKDKKKKTFTKNYGVDNIWKLREYRLWWEAEMIKKHGKVNLGDLYGNENSWGWKTTNDEDKVLRTKKANDGYKIWYENLSDDEKVEYNQAKGNKIVSLSPSQLEKRIENILLNNQIQYKPQYWINQKSYDFLIYPKIIIEIQGSYWHCDPRIYKSNDLIKRDNELKLVNEIWEYDEKKKINATNYGYNIFYLWEEDINNLTNYELLIQLKNIINENQVNSENNK